jgi:hypothetical protein
MIGETMDNKAEKIPFRSAVIKENKEIKVLVEIKCGIQEDFGFCFLIGKTLKC